MCSSARAVVAAKHLEWQNRSKKILESVRPEDMVVSQTDFDMHTHTHTHTHARARAHTQHTHAHTCTHTHTHTHTHTGALFERCTLTPYGNEVKFRAASLHKRVNNPDENQMKPNMFAVNVCSLCSRMGLKTRRQKDSIEWTRHSGKVLLLKQE